MKKTLVSALALAVIFLIIGPTRVALSDAPASPSLLPVILNNKGELIINWTGNDPDAVGYQLYQGLWGGTPGDPVYTTSTSMALDATVFNPYNTTYCFYVRAVGSDPQNQYSVPSVVQSIYVGAFIPPPPGNLKCVSAGPDQVELKWEDTCPWKNTTAVWYGIHGQYSDFISTAVAAGVTSAVITDLQPNTDYDFYVKAQSAHGASDPSNVITVNTSNNQYVMPDLNTDSNLGQNFWPTPTDLVAQAQSGQLVQLQWTDGCDGETGFRIMRQDGVNGTMIELATADANATGYPDPNVEAGHTYIYKICAIYPNGDSDYSNTASAVVEEVSNGMTSIEMRFQVGVPEFSLNGNYVAMDAAPIAVEGRILLPIRYVVESLGGTASWISNTAIISCNGHVLDLWLGQNTASVDGASKMIDPDNAAVVPVESNSRIMMPLRFVSENINCDASWNGSEAVITYPKM